MFKSQLNKKYTDNILPQGPEELIFKNGKPHLGFAWLQYVHEVLSNGHRKGKSSVLIA